MFTIELDEHFDVNLAVLVYLWTISLWGQISEIFFTLEIKEFANN